MVGIGWFPMIEAHAAPVSYGNLGSCHAGTVATEREERRETDTGERKRSEIFDASEFIFTSDVVRRWHHTNHTNNR